MTDSLINAVVGIVLLGLLVAVIRQMLKGFETRITESINEINTDMKVYNTRHHECREDFIERFADKTETKDEFARVWIKSENHTSQLDKMGATP